MKFRAFLSGRFMRSCPAGSYVPVRRSGDSELPGAENETSNVEQASDSVSLVTQPALALCSR